jgi:hypothetical protein
VFLPKYISIQIILSDDTYRNTVGDSYNRVVYDLAWYAEEGALERKAIKGVETEYIIISDNKEGPTYAHLYADVEERTNVIYSAEVFNQIEKYHNIIQQKAQELQAGSDVDFIVPAVDWLIKDNGGYRNLKFTISYKRPSSNQPQMRSALSYNNLKFPVLEEGVYTFKIFAVDKGGNTMKYFLDGELVNVTAENVWEIEEIPSFSFEIPSTDNVVGIISEGSVENVNSTYAFSGGKDMDAICKQNACALYHLTGADYKKLKADKRI